MLNTYIFGKMKQQWIHGMYTSKTVRPDPHSLTKGEKNYDYHVIRSTCKRLYCGTHGINKCAEGQSVSSKHDHCRRIKPYRNKQQARNIADEIAECLIEYYY